VAEEIGLVGGPGPEEAAPAGPTQTGLVSQANEAYDRAVAAQRAGDWAAYGEALQELGRILDELAGQ
jgi:hypothetical protein